MLLGWNKERLKNQKNPNGMDWKDIEKVYHQFHNSRTLSETEVVQQVFYRMVGWLYERMPEEEARNFMAGTVDPDPIIDWETGLELGDPCPKHPDKKLCCFVPPIENRIYLECLECF